MTPPDGSHQEGQSDTDEFEAVMALKNEPLILNEEEAARFDELCKRRAPRLGKPLPITNYEGGHP